MPICDDCKKSKHDCHKIELLDHAVKQKKSLLTSSVKSQRSKIPFMDNIIQNAKEEEKKYSTHIRQNTIAIPSNLWKYPDNDKSHEF